MTTAEIATAFAERGWYVLPCYPQQKIPFFPIAKQGYKSASNKPATVKKWFEKSPFAKHWHCLCALKSCGL
jgi:hypothetical protein